MDFQFTYPLCLLAPLTATGEPVAFGGHSYELISVPAGISSESAGAVAYNREYLGTGGHLATVNSAAENAFIFSTFSNSSLAAVWISGISRIEELPGSGFWWQWRQTGELVSYRNWATGEPNDFSPSGTSSVSVEISLREGGGWYDRPASATSFGYLVEYNAAPVATRLSTSFTDNALLISWPSNYVGFRLESNSVSLVATGMWFTVPGSVSSNRLSIPVNASGSNIYFRLVYP